ncbi:MAG: hypothetical protein ACR2PZ_19660 [Pseudomonadales bacterium]
MRNLIVLVLLCMVSAACWNGGHNEIDLGTVSIGQQLIDLKAALEIGAINVTEYEDTKTTLLSLNTVCHSIEEEQ